jgi:murein DD-endopeptidase MepM/ murein hydrolase activator NlpD
MALRSRLVPVLVAALLTLASPPARSVGSAPDAAPEGAQAVGVEVGRASGVWPLQPQPAVVHGFDPPSVPWGAGHRGVDLAGHVGEPVHAAMAGTVSFAARIAGVGMVVVDHGPTRTTYQPVVATVRRGQRVAAGAVIGRLQWTGTHCLPDACLHWGWIRGTVYLDPLRLVGGGPSPVRLLPFAALVPGWTG